MQTKVFCNYHQSSPHCWIKFSFCWNFIYYIYKIYARICPLFTQNFFFFFLYYFFEQNLKYLNNEIYLNFQYPCINKLCMRKERALVSKGLYYIIHRLLWPLDTKGYSNPHANLYFNVIFIQKLNSYSGFLRPFWKGSILKKAPLIDVEM